MMGLHNVVLDVNVTSTNEEIIKKKKKPSGAFDCGEMLRTWTHQADEQQCISAHRQPLSAYKSTCHWIGQFASWQEYMT